MPTTLTELLLLAGALPAGLTAAWVRARYAERPAPGRVETATLVLACLLAALWALFERNAALAEGCVFGWLLIALAAVDLERRRLPDPLTLALVAAGLVATWLRAPSLLLAHALTAAAAWGLFYLLGELYFRWRGRDGLGLGDAKMMAGLGAWVGPLGLPTALLIGGLGALGALLARAAATRAPLSAGAAIAFGPYLALGGWLVWLYGPIDLAGALR